MKKTLLVLFLSSFLFTCTLNAKELEKISLQLQWKYQFQFAGFIMAKELGYYEEMGLDVELLEYDNSDIMQDLLDDKIDFAISNSILIYKNHELLDVTLLATYFQRSPLVLITQPSIKTISNIKGKSVMMNQNDRYNSSLTMLLNYFSIDANNTKFVNPTFCLDDFIEKKVDVISAFKSNEILDLNERGIEYNVFDPVEYGFPTNAINLFASHTKVANRPKLIHNFIDASNRGWKYALAHTDKVAQLIHEKYQPKRSYKLLKYAGAVTKEMMLQNIYEVGEINREFINKKYKQLCRNKVLSPDLDTSKLIYLEAELTAKNSVVLSLEEKKWIDKNPIITYSEVNWKPLSIIKNGEMHGIMRDYLDLITECTGIVFKYIPSTSWEDVLQKFKDKKIDLIPGIGSSTQEKSLGIFSEQYAEYPIAIVTDDTYSFLDSLSEFNNKTIAIPKYYTSYNFLKEHYPHINILATTNIEEALTLVATGKADAFIGHIATSLYYISELNLNTLKVSGTTFFTFKHSYLIQKDYAKLKSIIDKALFSISEEEKNTIKSRWIHTKVEKKADNSSIYKVIAIASFIVLFFLYQQRLLQKYNKSLEKIKERMDLALDGSQDAVWDWNILTNELFVSPRWKEISGYTSDDITADLHTWKKQIHPNDFKNVLKAIFECIKGRQEYINEVYRYRHQEGHWIWIHLRGKVILNDESQAIRMTGTHTDITLQKKLKLKYLHQEFIIGQIRDAIILTDLDGTIVRWNEGAEKIFAYTSEEIIGQNISILNREEDNEAFKRNMNLAIERGGYSEDVYRITKFKKIISIALSISLLKDENGKTVGVIGYAQDISARKKVEIELQEKKATLYYQAHHDALTGLANRVLFNDRLEHGLQKAKRYNNILALLFIDLDRFKEINDSLGHSVGDKVLQAVTKLLSASIRQKDTLARLGGDEFTVIMEDLVHGEDASQLSQKIINILSEPLIIEEHELYISSSIGISLYPSDGATSQNLLKFADAAMYKAKNEGRNNFQFYSAEMTEVAHQRVVMETYLRTALKKEEFLVYYQPQVDATDNSLVGMEALVRWKHPTQGLISPAEFIPIAESTGIIIEIDRFVMKTAMAQFVQWYKKGLNPGVLALNISVKQLLQKDFVAVLVGFLKETNCQAKWIEIEVTESQIMSNPERAIKILQQINDLGVELAIDDFGTGYSSLAYLKKLPIDKLKIDKSFIDDIPYNKEDVAITKAVIDLSKNLNLKVIAEGVETQEQKQFLVQNGCHLVQGYFYSRPISADKMLDYISEPSR